MRHERCIAECNHAFLVEENPKMAALFDGYAGLLASNLHKDVQRYCKIHWNLYEFVRLNLYIYIYVKYKDVQYIYTNWIYTLHFQVSQTSLPMWLGPKRLARGTILGLHMCHELHPRLRTIEGNANTRWKVQHRCTHFWYDVGWHDMIDWINLREGLKDLWKQVNMSFRDKHVFHNTYKTWPWCWV